MLLNYILAFAIGYLISDIVNGVKKRLREYPLQQAMQAQQIKFTEECLYKNEGQT